MALLTCRRLSALVTSVLVCALSTSVVCAQSPGQGEKAVKAAFLYNFTKFVEWPPSAFEGDATPFRVCVFGDQSFRREVEAMMAGESVAGRPVQVSAPPANELRRCHIAYFGASEAERAAQLMAQLQKFPVLTVGEGTRFLGQGGLIAFAIQDDRVRFDVNKRGADRTGLVISSKLLRVARHVDMSAPAQPPQS